MTHGIILIKNTKNGKNEIITHANVTVDKIFPKNENYNNIFEKKSKLPKIDKSNTKTQRQQQ